MHADSNFVKRMILACAFAALSYAFAMLTTPMLAFGNDGVAEQTVFGAATQDVKEDEANAAKWHRKDMSPGESYDIGKAKSNTTIYITKPGTYELSGHSKKCCVEISSGDVVLYLKDGLNIDTSILSQVGQCSPGITIGDQGGTVTICTRSGATAKISGYLGGAAIQKDGRNTKLVFTTEDPGNPGTLNVIGSNSIEGGAGIGTSSHAMFTGRTTGNIVIESGNINARGGVNSAGIGGGDHGDLDGLIINGGTVSAKGGSNIGLVTGGAAGIGGGFMSNGKNITINGGTVRAIGGENGAGIGGGMPSSGHGGDGVNVTINGGDVEALGTWGGAGVGGGWEGNAYNIKIAGGKVSAVGGKMNACAIGGGGGSFYGTGTNIVISGGEVTATAEGLISTGAAIGSTKSGDGATSVTISGGRVGAVAKSGFAIGGGGKNGVTSKGGSTKVAISGGTVITAADGSSHIGSGNKDCSISIIGGSVNTVVDSPVVNQKGDELALSRVRLFGAEKNVAVASLKTTGADPAYGVNDVLTGNEGQIYLWLPKNATIDGATIQQGDVFAGSVAAGNNGSLYPVSRITLKANGDGEADGSATVSRGKTVLDDMIAPVRKGYTLIGFASDKDGNSLVADSHGVLKANTSYTDEDGRWAVNGGSCELYAQWLGDTYSLRYEQNVPTDASTVASGFMDEKTGLTYGQPFTADSCGYSLPGYDFIGWNTAADGSGRRYAPGEEVNDLDIDSSGVARLYACWCAKTYTVSFTTDTYGWGDDYRQEFVFDQPARLEEYRFTPRYGYEFTGWTVKNSIGALYQDKALVCNLCTVGADGELIPKTLMASWVQIGTVTVAVTNDGEAVSGLASRLKLETLDAASTVEGGQEGMIGGTFVETSKAGIYQCNDVPYGVYSLTRDGEPTGKTAEVGISGIAAIYLDYCTVKVEGCDECDTYFLAQGGRTQMVSDVLVGSTLQLRSDVKRSCAFIGYVATGCDPTWENGDSSLPNQTITVNGQTTVKSLGGPGHYRVIFHANGGAGDMPSQDFAIGEAKALSANSFTREHHSFACWTSTTAWDGTTFSDGEMIGQSLTTETDATVDLYAQWEPDAYWVEFNGNGGNVGYMGFQKMFFGQPSNLEKSKMTMKDHRFIGWNTEADGSGMSYEDEACVQDLTAQKDGVVTLWAQWERDRYTVAFDANGGAGEMDEQVIPTHAADRIEACDFWRDGYEFAGWNTAADGSGASYGDAADVIDLADAYATVVLYAQWKALPTPAPTSVDPCDAEDNTDGDDNDAQALVNTGDSLACPILAFAVIAASVSMVIVVIRKRL